MTIDVHTWLDSAGCGPADERLLSGVELPLDAGLAAMPSGTTASDAALDR